MVQSYSDFRALDPSKYIDNVSPGRTATIVVAALNSSLQSKAQADFVCDGVADQVEIQAAINAVGSGGKVQLTEGNYSISADVYLHNYVEFCGYGFNTVLKDAGSGANIVLLRVQAVSGVYIHDLTLDGNQALTGAGSRNIYITLASTDVLVERCWIKDYTAIGVQTVAATSKATIQDCLFTNVKHAVNVTGVGATAGTTIYARNNIMRDSYLAFYLVDAVDCVIENNIISGYVSSLQIVAEGSDRTTIRNNFIEGYYGAAYAQHGIILDSCDYCLIEGNTVKSHTDVGIQLRSSHHNTIKANLCYDNYVGIYIGSGPGTECNYNLIEGNNCSENTRTGGGQDGITLIRGDGNSIIGNVCYGNGDDGMDLCWSTHTVCVGNQCENNGDNGIDCWGTGALIEGNICRGNLSGGIAVFSVISAENIQIIGNSCSNNGADPEEAFDDSGIVIISDDVTKALSNFVIAENRCWDDQGIKTQVYGIRIYVSGTGVCDGNIVRDNYLVGNKTGAISDGGTNTKFAKIVVPFTTGVTYDSGWIIDAAAETAAACIRLPEHVQQVMKITIYALSWVAEVHAMRLDTSVLGGADNEPYNTHTANVPDVPSKSINFAALDIICWELTSAGILALTGGDSVAVKVLYEDAGNGDCATNAALRTAEIAYV